MAIRLAWGQRLCGATALPHTLPQGPGGKSSVARWGLRETPGQDGATESRTLESRPEGQEAPATPWFAEGRPRHMGMVCPGSLVCGRAGTNGHLHGSKASAGPALYRRHPQLSPWGAVPIVQIKKWRTGENGCILTTKHSFYLFSSTDTILPKILSAKQASLTNNLFCFLNNYSKTHTDKQRASDLSTDWPILKR